MQLFLHKHLWKAKVSRSIIRHSAEQEPMSNRTLASRRLERREGLIKLRNSSRTRISVWRRLHDPTYNQAASKSGGTVKIRNTCIERRKEMEICSTSSKHTSLGSKRITLQSTMERSAASKSVWKRGPAEAAGFNSNRGWNSCARNPRTLDHTFDLDTFGREAAKASREGTVSEYNTVT